MLLSAFCDASPNVASTFDPVLGIRPCTTLALLPRV